MLSLIIKGDPVDAVMACQAHGIDSVSLHRYLPKYNETIILVPDPGDSRIHKWFAEDTMKYPRYSYGSLLFFSEVRT